MNAAIDPTPGRIDYLRLSITDRCNLRCTYCMPAEGVPPRGHDEILSYEELVAFTRAAADYGISKVRITGGEPLVRRDIVPFVGRLAAVRGVRDLAMTTNGTALPEMAVPLRKAGLSRVNVSLDTIRRDRYAEITRRDALPRVLSGIEAAVRAGLSPVKINVVLLHGLLPAEVDDFLALSREMPVEVRFIERMPIGCSPSGAFMSAEGVRERILSLPGAREAGNGGPSAAVTYDVPGVARKAGIISPVSRKFCERCSRLRVTADGRVRSCLFGRETLDLRSVLRSGRGDDAVAELLRSAVRAKPEGHDLCGGGDAPSAAEPMSRVGG